MISTACYPYPVNDKSTARRVALRPHIYSPSESHSSPRNIMYPHPHISGSPSPNYIYSGYEQFYSKNSWPSATSSSWSTHYPLPLSSSLPEAAVNPKVTILPSQPALVSDIDTPSSVSSHSILTPSSPFAMHDMNDTKFQSMELDEFDYDDDDDDEDYIDSDFADEMEGIDETDLEESLVYGASAPHVIKSTSALEGALGDTPSSFANPNLGSTSPADRRLSASVPGYPSASSRPTAPSHHRLTSSSPPPEVSYPPHTYTHRNASSPSYAQTTSTLYNHVSSSSLAGAFTTCTPSHTSRSTSHPLPILQPQPIRPIPPIPLADLTSGVDDSHSPDPCVRASRASLRTLSRLPLLCQPVSDAVRYQLKQPSSGGRDVYNEENDSMCEDVITESGSHPRFAQHGLTFCQSAPTDGTSSVGEKIYSYGCVGLPMRWQ